MPSAARSVGLVIGLALVCACAGNNPPASAPMTNVSVAPAMTIERFLRAANQNDLDTMASLFGTRDGSVTRTWTPREVDERMVIFSNVLRHSDYRIVGEQVVPGRRDEATQLNVNLVIGSDTLQVPFVLVRTVAGQSWLIEQIGIEAVTRGAGSRGSR